MTTESIRCVLLADPHHGVSEGIRNLLETEFEAVVMVADEPSLAATAERLKPKVVVADFALARGECFGWLRRLRTRCPDLPVIVLSTHDAQAFIEAAFEAGAAGVVLKRDLASELLNAVDAVLGGRRYPPASLLPQGSHRPGKVIARDVEVSQTVNNQNKTKGMNTT